MTKAVNKTKSCQSKLMFISRFYHDQFPFQYSKKEVGIICIVGVQSKDLELYIQNLSSLWGFTHFS